ncbi:putative protein [Arabidopsis thaliana]|nr:putative protein [Arabidopsis thaliana]CAB79510.1 putative protein [Arabidopsis thaliana]
MAMAMEISLPFVGSSMALSAGKSRNSVSRISRVGFSSVSAVHVPRRMFMQLSGFGSVLTLLDFPSLAAPVPQMKEPEVISCGVYQKTLKRQRKISDRRRSGLSLFAFLEDPETQKMSQGWFSMGGSSTVDQQQQSGSSLLADWNSYAASRDFEESGGSFGFDIESAVRSANDTVSGTFSVCFQESSFVSLIKFLFFCCFCNVPEFDDYRVSKGVRDIPGSLQSATSSMPSGKALMYFGLLLASGVFFIFIAFTMFLPVMVLMPQKFAICFTLGCGFIIGSFFALRGPKNQLAHMSSMEVCYTVLLCVCHALNPRRLPSTLGFIATMVGTIYVSMVLHSYILSVLFSVLQVLALVYYCISYFPGGSSGMRFLSSALTSSALRVFGR